MNYDAGMGNVAMAALLSALNVPPADWESVQARLMSKKIGVTPTEVRNQVLDAVFAVIDEEDQ